MLFFERVVGEDRYGGLENSPEMVDKYILDPNMAKNFDFSDVTKDMLKNLLELYDQEYAQMVIDTLPQKQQMMVINMDINELYPEGDFNVELHNEYIKKLKRLHRFLINFATLHLIGKRLYSNFILFGIYL